MTCPTSPNLIYIIKILVKHRQPATEKPRDKCSRNHLPNGREVNTLLRRIAKPGEYEHVLATQKDIILEVVTLGNKFRSKYGVPTSVVAEKLWKIIQEHGYRTYELFCVQALSKEGIPAIASICSATKYQPKVSARLTEQYCMFVDAFDSWLKAMPIDTFDHGREVRSA